MTNHPCPHGRESDLEYIMHRSEAAVRRRKSTMYDHYYNTFLYQQPFSILRFCVEWYFKDSRRVGMRLWVTFTDLLHQSTKETSLLSCIFPRVPFFWSVSGTQMIYETFAVSIQWKDYSNIIHRRHYSHPALTNTWIQFHVKRIGDT